MELSPLMWIIIGVVALVVIAALIIAYGLRRSKSKQISFEKKEEIEQKKPSSGNYQAQSGFNFTSGGGATTIGGVEINKPEQGKDKDAEKEAIPRSGQELKAPAEETPEQAPKQPAQPDQPAEGPEAPVPPAASSEGEAGSGADTTAESDSAMPQQHQGEQVDDADIVPPAPSINEVSEAPKAEDAPLDEAIEAEIDKPAETSEQQLEEAEQATASATPAAPVAPAAPATPVAETAEDSQTEKEATTQPADGTPAQDEIAPVHGRISKLRGRMSKSQNIIGRGVLGILSAGDLDEDAWEDIEDTLLMADLGTKTTMAVVDDLRQRIAVNGVSSEEEARAMLRDALIDACKPEMDRSIKAMPYDGKPAVIMVVGVNGTGKTTTTGKLSRVLIGMGHSVTLGAADTFRAAAADQLETWGRRVGAQTVRGAEGADPASVAFDSVAKGIEDGTDVVLIDTAGRLHTSVGLMDQLGKVKRVVEKKAKVDEVLLVLDATVGQNGLMQARVFREVVDITGVVLTKLDGTAKGGIVFQVQEELGVPVKLVGLGEGADHLAPFEVESFVDALLG